MKLKITVALFVIVLGGTLCFGLDPVGPPVAGLSKARFSAGIEYSYSQVDLEYDSIPSLGIGSGKLSNNDMNKVYGRLAMGYNKNWELFLRLGAVEEDYIDDSSFDFAIGGGTKITFYDEGILKWGVAGQFIYYEKDSDTVNGTLLGQTFTGDTDADIYEIQIATGPKITLTPNISAYGGALWYIVEGDLDIDGTLGGTPGSWSTDIEEDSAFGGFAGIQIDLDKKTDWNIEYQCVSGGYGVATQIVWRF
ncbi:MAG: hypothetical protein ACYTE8_11420 [Planctomycetota bacterium]|jgi:hypothetical protein